MISPHWGTEYRTNTFIQKENAELLFNAGADCIIGHHPHILLPLEYTRTNGRYERFIAHSLGNFIANIGREYDPGKPVKDQGSPRRSVVLFLTVRVSGEQAYLSEYHTAPVWIHNNYNAFQDKKDKERIIMPYMLNSVPEEVLTPSQTSNELGYLWASLRTGPGHLR